MEKVRHICDGITETEENIVGSRAKFTTASNFLEKLKEQYEYIYPENMLYESVTLSLCANGDPFIIPKPIPVFMHRSNVYNINNEKVTLPDKGKDAILMGYIIRQGQDGDKHTVYCLNTGNVIYVPQSCILDVKIPESRLNKRG